ncbi:MAG: class I SAM-dependent methyltransferase [Saprospiraceae bacterium]
MNAATRKLYYSIPPAWRFAVRRLYYLPLDTWESLTGQRDGLMPPRGLIFTGGGDFRKTGEMLAGYFKEYCSLLPHYQVLDIGSGMGRIAIPLTRFLNEKGNYEGFDVVQRGVDWCTKNITARYPNFNFRYIPLDNDLYRAGGDSAVHFTFPYADESFDLCVVNSVFTHMVPEEVENYFTEVRRVLKPGGVCYATFFLFDGKTAFPKGFDFPFDHGHYRLMDEQVKSANVAFEEGYLIKELVGKNGFSLRHLFYGSWRGLPPEGCKEFQDITIFEKLRN